MHSSAKYSCNRLIQLCCDEPELGRDEVFYNEKRRRVTQAQAIQAYNNEIALLFFQRALSSLPDPRRCQGKRFHLKTIVVIALMAMVCGADDAQAMESWGKKREDWLKTIFPLPHGAPTQDVYLRVFAALDTEAFQDVVSSWAQVIYMQLKNSVKNISIDGKASRRSHDTAKGVSAIHTVSAWCREAGIVIGQTKTEEKSNEIVAIPKLLQKLDINNATITIDAMGCQTEIADLIIQKGGSYLLAVKENQASLHHDIETAFNYVDICRIRTEQKLDIPLLPPAIERYAEVNKDHGRLEKRTIEICRDLDWVADHKQKWTNLAYIVRVTRERTQIAKSKTSLEIAYYIGSHTEIEIKSIADSIRGHWSIENSLHWVLDMAFREDEARHRAGNAAANMSTLRHFALNLIKQDKTRKVGIANARKEAGWDNDYLIHILTSARNNLYADIDKADQDLPEFNIKLLDDDDGII